MDDQGMTREPPAVDAEGLGAGVECREYLAEVHEFLDGELGAERRTVVEIHLERCGPCLDAYDFEAELRVVVSTSCQENELPEGLRDRIASLLRDLADEL
ncbi:MAG TPA: mycothiol system anti-sigma-R factor [Acidimicrobiales bacterium]|nr:mycothiol system anti-sigma-R factor [Acidimicrobiales bacterium]